jgi:hypothetical protein
LLQCCKVVGNLVLAGDSNHHPRQFATAPLAP